MGEGCWELVAPDETAVRAETLLDASVMEDLQRNKRLSNPSSANQGNRFEVFSETDDLLDQFVAPEADPRGRGRQFARHVRCKYDRLDYRLNC